MRRKERGHAANSAIGPLPGFDIDKPRHPFSLAQTIAMFKNIIQQTCPAQRVVLMVHDWGCVFGYQLVMRHPSLVSKIVGVAIGDAGTSQHCRGMPKPRLAIAWRIGGSIGDKMTKSMPRALKCPADPQFIDSRMNFPYYIKWTGTHGS